MQKLQRERFAFLFACCGGWSEAFRRLCSVPSVASASALRFGIWLWLLAALSASASPMLAEKHEGILPSGSGNNEETEGLCLQSAGEG
jgi:hypothetical protein